MKKVVLLGAGGFAKEIIWVIEEINLKTEEYGGSLAFQLLGLMDEDETKAGSRVLGYEVYGEIKKPSFWTDKDDAIYAVCTVGKAKNRALLVNKALKLKYTQQKIIHPEAIVSAYAELSCGVIVMPGAVISVGANIGDQVLINKLCSVGHDSVIGRNTTLAPGVIIGGNAIIGVNCDIGMNVSILPEIKVGKGSVVGAGAVVTKDIPDYCTAVGAPARPI